MTNPIRDSYGVSPQRPLAGRRASPETEEQREFIEKWT
jgi:hypothetical protein